MRKLRLKIMCDLLLNNFNKKPQTYKNRGSGSVTHPHVIIIQLQQFQFRANVVLFPLSHLLSSYPRLF